MTATDITNRELGTSTVRLRDIATRVHFDADELNYFTSKLHEAGVGYGNFALIFKLRHGGDLETATADQVNRLLNRPLNTVWLDSTQINFDEPSVTRSIEAHWDSYVSVGRFRASRRVSDEATWIPGVWADFDLKPAHERGFTTSAELDTFTASIAPPTLLVDSGSGGRHPYWLLTGNGLADMKKSQELLKRWHALLLVKSQAVRKHVDLGVFDLARILRLPGTARHPKHARHETIMTSRPVRLLTADGPRYSLDDLLALTKSAYATVVQEKRTYQRIERADNKVRLEKLSARGLGVAMYHDVVSVFEQTQDWAPMLLATGWKLDSDNRDAIGRSTAACYWTRPGKDLGVSADTNFRDSNIMFVFSDDPSLDDLFVGPRNGMHHIVSKYRYALVRLYHGNEAKLIKDIIAGGGRVI